ncbi:MAG: ribokinase [Actinomycetales bacterium]|nr:ribokinase [Actinomycetales bacterium]
MSQPANNKSSPTESVVVVVGSLNTDFVLTLDAFPAAGESVLGKTFEQAPGGKGLNQAVAASRLGAQVAMIGAVGGDQFGPGLIQTLADEGIDSLVSQIPDTSTGMAIIEVEGSGENRIIVVSGANNFLSEDSVETSLREIAGERRIGVVLTQGEVPVQATERALRVAKELGAITILNPAPVRDFPPSVFPLVDYLVPNELEAQGLCTLEGNACKSMLDFVEVATSIVDLGVGSVIITRGEKGAVWSTATASGQAAAFRIVPVDTVAAGDAFCGGLAAALNEGQPLNEALRWASAAGALTATRVGAITSLPRRSEVEELLI